MNCDEASPASDMWGVGVIAYQMCSGKDNSKSEIQNIKFNDLSLEIFFKISQMFWPIGQMSQMNCGLFGEFSDIFSSKLFFSLCLPT
jgi:hypothetical protein